MFRASLLAGILLSTSAHAFLIEPWQLEVPWPGGPAQNYFFQWNDWTEVFEFGPCSSGILYRIVTPPPGRHPPPYVELPPFVEPIPLFYNPDRIYPPPGWSPPLCFGCNVNPLSPSSTVPEPATWAMMLVGFLKLAQLTLKRVRA